MRRGLNLLIIVMVAACGGGGSGSDPRSPASLLAVEVLESGVYLDRFPFQRLRLNKPGQPATYAMWFPPVGATPAAKAAAVVVADPYSGIDWTAENVDTAAFARAGDHRFHMLEDINGPGHDPALPVFVPYKYSGKDDAGGTALAFLLNGIGVIVSYQRFYAGGSLQNDIDDTLTALEFVQSLDTVDRNRIGVWGSSYGASLVLHTAVQAPAGRKPQFGALSTPFVDYRQVVDFASWMQATHSDPGKAYLRFEPFVRRAVAAATPASGAANLDRYASTALNAGLDTKMLFVHDMFDTIAPLLQATEVFFGVPGRHQVFLYPHQGVDLDWNHLDIGHAPVAPGYEEGSALLFTWAYLVTRLAPPQGELLLLRLPTFDEAVFKYLHDQGALGFDLNTYVVPRLLELCDPRIQLVRFEDNFQGREPGRRFVARILKTYWQVEVAEADAATWLRNNGL